MATMTIRVDDTLKKNFDSLCDQFGLSNTAALNLFMKAVVRERKIPFEIKAAPSDDTESKGWKAFLRMRNDALSSEAASMTLDDINDEIAAARNERK